MDIPREHIPQIRPLHFRVLNVDRNLLPDKQIGPSWQIELTIEAHAPNGTALYLTSIMPVNTRRKMHFRMSGNWFEPYQAAVTEAIESGAVYWVDWPFQRGLPTLRSILESIPDSPLDRLLNAIRDRQLVRPQP